MPRQLLWFWFWFPRLHLLFLQPPQAEATAYGIEGNRLPPAYIAIDGKASRLQLENSDPLSGDDRTADYSSLLRGQYHLVSASNY